jgi:hypothetical protein
MAALSIPQPSAEMLAGDGRKRRNGILRRQARTDYLVDPDGHSVRWHWERTDRMYRELIHWTTFDRWSKEDGWFGGRTKFWEEMEERVFAYAKDRALRQRLDEINRVSDLLNTFEKFLKPLCDDDGNPLLDDNGLPKLGVKLPPLDRMVGSWLDLHERLMRIRGEAIQAPKPAESDKGVAAFPSEHVRDPVADGLSLTRDDLRYLARSFVRMRIQESDSPPKEPPDGTDS